MRRELKSIETATTTQIASTVTIVGRGKVILGDYVTIESHVLLDTGSSQNSVIYVGSRSKLKHGAVLRTYDGEIRIGKRTSIGEYSILSGHGGLTIGDLVIVAGHCYFSAADHIFHGTCPIRFQGETTSGIRVNDGVWVGARCIILDGVVVGQNTAVGAGSIITRDLPPDSLCFGSPCRVIRDRQTRAEDHW